MTYRIDDLVEASVTKSRPGQDSGLALEESRYGSDGDDYSGGDDYGDDHGDLRILVAGIGGLFVGTTTTTTSRGAVETAVHVGDQLLTVNGIEVDDKEKFPNGLKDIRRFLKKEWNLWIVVKKGSTTSSSSSTVVVNHRNRKQKHNQIQTGGTVTPTGKDWHNNNNNNNNNNNTNEVVTDTDTDAYSFESDATTVGGAATTSNRNSCCDSDIEDDEDDLSPATAATTKQKNDIQKIQDWLNEGKELDATDDTDAAAAATDDATTSNRHSSDDSDIDNDPSLPVATTKNAVKNDIQKIQDWLNEGKELDATDDDAAAAATAVATDDATTSNRHSSDDSDIDNDPSPTVATTKHAVHNVQKIQGRKELRAADATSTDTSSSDSDDNDLSDPAPIVSSEIIAATTSHNGPSTTTTTTTGCQIPIPMTMPSPAEVLCKRYSSLISSLTEASYLESLSPKLPTKDDGDDNSKSSPPPNEKATKTETGTTATVASKPRRKRRSGTKPPSPFAALTRTATTGQQKRKGRKPKPSSADELSNSSEDSGYCSTHTHSTVPLSEEYIGDEKENDDDQHQHQYHTMCQTNGTLLSVDEDNDGANASPSTTTATLVEEPTIVLKTRHRTRNKSEEEEEDSFDDSTTTFYQLQSKSPTPTRPSPVSVACMTNLIDPGDLMTICGFEMNGATVEIVRKSKPRCGSQKHSRSLSRSKQTSLYDGNNKQQQQQQRWDVRVIDQKLPRRSSNAITKQPQRLISISSENLKHFL